MRIHALDEQTILKIAAGEVIENPASVVKELIENAIDANATQITAEIKDGGKQSIRVTDNGDGIHPEEIDLAFTRHATSKIDNYEDLFAIGTMGFRGEALASIRAVSDVTVFSRQAEQETGSFVRYRGEETQREAVAHNQGTTMVVEHLFSRIPVRAGFLKSSLAEANRITDLLYRFSVAHPDISFKYIKDEKLLLSTTGSGIENTLTEVFGPDVTEKLLPLSYRDAQIEMKGWVADTSLYRGNRSMQYVFVNRRIVTEPMITQLVESAYGGKIPHGRFPVYFLWVDIDPAKIDVNIHPTKSKVQWTEDSSVFLPLKTEILRLLEQQQHQHILTEKEEKKPERVNLFTMDEYEDRRRKEAGARHVAEPKTPYQSRQKPFPQERKSPTPEQLPLSMPVSEEVEMPSRIFEGLRLIGSFHKTYVLFEDAAREEMVFVDQHAAHERILFEQLQEEYRKRELRTQMLLVPQRLKVKPHEKDALESRSGLFSSLGFLIDPLSEDTFLIRGIPYQIGRMQDPRNLVYALLDTLEKSVRSQEQDLEERLMKMACTEAVKAGDTLPDLSVAQLLSALEKTKQPHTCPHGRPTYVRVPLKQIHKWFQRIPS